MAAGWVVVVMVLSFLLMLIDSTGPGPLWVAPFPRLCAKCGERLSIREHARMYFSLLLTWGCDVTSCFKFLLDFQAMMACHLGL